MKYFRMILICQLMALASFGATDIVFPWVTNNSLYQGKVVVNNLNGESVDIQLIATRASGESETVDLTIDPYSQFVSSTNNLFTELGEGPGYTVFLSSTSDNIEGAFVVSGTGSSSGSSPAQGNVVPESSGSQFLLYSYLPIPANPPADSAPMVVNLGDTTANVTFHAFQNGQEVGAYTTTVIARAPFAQVTSAMFPEASGDLFVVAEGDQPMLGMAFIFNDFQEPSMANAVATNGVPNPGGSQGVSFANDVQTIFSNSCAVSGCHGNGAMSGGMNLDPGNAYGNIVNVDSSEMPSLKRILPFDADNSFLYQKVNPAFIGGHWAQPSEEELNTLRDWINQGAQDN